MITLTIASILLTAAVPPMQDFITRNRMSTEVNTFIASLYLARSEAVKRMQNVKICPTTNYTSCTGDTNWEPGWMVFLDVNNDDIVTPGADVVLQQNPALPSRFKIIGNQQSFAYDSTGKLFNPGTNGNYKFCDTDSVAQARKVTVSREGRVRVDQLTTSGCT